MESKIKSTSVFEGSIISVNVDDVISCNGKNVKREIVYHNGGSAIALKNNDNQYYLVRQYRYAQGIDMLEFPAGKLEINENPLQAIKRECMEELGYSAKNIQDLGVLVLSGAYLTERIYMYHGIQDQYVGQNLDDDEQITIELYTLNQLLTMVENNIIIDAKTIAMILKIKLLNL